ncbi:52 kDa repressor of the inhibitor of the protein kinase-like [Rhopalosiphum padi]|uniref:52 kDa repressor of the inhibitor of the protein kinase-like n=1 Tax=Rhopalosiphum padi TaxID=40932 RepID=UPI00298E7614|nr:52 kDa repressor of the inhibitor of the protein kinase-like [Rhopalosiphum padi]
MSGKYKGVQAIVRAEYPKAIYVHCAAHTLNLAVSNASNIQPIRNCLGIIEKLYDFFNTPKRNNMLLNCIENVNETPNAKSLKRLCATRWIQRYDAVSDFVELFPYVIDALYNISNWHDSSATDASLLSKSIDSEFIISLQVVKLLFSYGLPLCKQLQKIKIDLKEAVELSNDTVKHLESIRANAEKEFHKLFVQAETMALVIDLVLDVKRITKRQKNRGNPCTDNARNLDIEEYYRITIFIPYLELFINELTERFLSHKSIFNGFECLFSKHELTTKEENEFTELIKFYSPMIQRCEKIPNTGLEALDICNKDIYPNIYVLLKVLCTLPVTTSSPERMFSTLKRVKTYLRNTMSENLLNGLAMLAIHKNITIDPEEVINELALKPRRVDLLL